MNAIIPECTPSKLQFAPIPGLDPDEAERITASMAQFFPHFCVEINWGHHQSFVFWGGLN